MRTIRNVGFYWENKHLHHQQQNYLQEKQSCGSRTYLQQKQPHQQHAAAEARSSTKLQKQQAAASRGAGDPALLGTRSNQPPQRLERPHLVRCPLRPRPSRTTHRKIKYNKIGRSSCSKLSPADIYYTVAPCQCLTQTDLAFCHRHIFITTRPAAQAQPHNNKPRQGSTVNKAS